MTSHLSGGYAKEPPTYGKVLLHTTVGDIDIELWPKQAPKACRNFVQLCMEEYYVDCIFHRVIRDFMAQTGDPTGTGTGGESIFGFPFKDEFHSRLKFSHRGIVAMANGGNKNDNLSQFFITLDKCDWLNRKHTIFGKVTGNTIYNVLKFNDLEINKETDRPMIEQKITSIEILLNPFDDIKPRMTRTERLKKEAAENDTKSVAKNDTKSVATKNVKLLAFGDDEEDEEIENELNALKETNAKIEKLRAERLQKDQMENAQNEAMDKLDEMETPKGDENKMMDIIRAKLAGNKSGKSTERKRTFSEMDGRNDGDLESSKRARINGNGGSAVNEEYERLKQQLLAKQRGVDSDHDDNADDGSKDGEEEDESALEKLMKQREEYAKRTRMNKRERNKQTAQSLNDFMKVIAEEKETGDLEKMQEKKKGKIDESTGIRFDSDSGDDDGYDPDWFKAKLESKRRPQDGLEIFTVDDYETIYGNSAKKEDPKRKEPERERGHSRNDRHYSDRRRDSDRRHYRDSRSRDTRDRHDRRRR